MNERDYDADAKKVESHFGRCGVEVEVELEVEINVSNREALWTPETVVLILGETFVLTWHNQ